MYIAIVVGLIVSQLLRQATMQSNRQTTFASPKSLRYSQKEEVEVGAKKCEEAHPCRI